MRLNPIASIDATAEQIKSLQARRSYGKVRELQIRLRDMVRAELKRETRWRRRAR